MVARLKDGNYSSQCDALMTARYYIKHLPDEVSFALTVTDEVELDSNILNIYVGTHDLFLSLQAALFPVRFPTEVGRHYVSYRVDALLISIVEPDTKDDP